MKKKYIFITLSSLAMFFFIFIKLISLFNSGVNENVFCMIKTKNNFMENCLIYLGLVLVLISIIGITTILYNPYSSNKNKK